MSKNIRNFDVLGLELTTKACTVKPGTQHSGFVGVNIRGEPVTAKPSTPNTTSKEDNVRSDSEFQGRLDHWRARSTAECNDGCNIELQHI